MGAKEYYNSTRMVETRNWTLDMAINFAEEFLQHRVNSIGDEEIDDTFSEEIFEYNGKRKGAKWFKNKILKL